jgi:hypothetical protein
VELDPDALERLRELDPGGQNQLLTRVLRAFDTSARRRASVPSPSREFVPKSRLRSGTRPWRGWASASTPWTAS